MRGLYQTSSHKQAINRRLEGKNDQPKGGKSVNETSPAPWGAGNQGGLQLVEQAQLGDFDERQLRGLQQ